MEFRISLKLIRRKNVLPTVTDLKYVLNSVIFNGSNRSLLTLFFLFNRVLFNISTYQAA